MAVSGGCAPGLVHVCRVCERRRALGAQVFLKGMVGWFRVVQDGWGWRWWLGGALSGRALGML